MNIAIDFDDTLTASPDLWVCFVNKCTELGHRVYCVTSRRDTEENCEVVNEWLDTYGIQMHVIFTSLRSKLDVMRERDIKIDIWIDDRPETIIRGW